MRRRHQLTLKSPPGTTGGRGQLSGSWSSDGTFFGTIKVLSGSELIAANQKYAKAQLEVITYKDSQVPITTKKRFEIDSRILEIGFVDDYIDQTGRTVRVLCSEVRDDA